MEKETLVQKLKIKNYNKELEEILINKSFSKNTKNLLSSMLYKIENSYEDYRKVKIQVASKKDFLEELINIIKRDCKDIEITKLNSEGNPISEGKKSLTIKEEKKIITYQNELALLKAIYEVNTNQFKEKRDEIEEKALFAFLNKGARVAKSEIIRDFDGWSWNILTSEIEDFIPNLIYQSMVYLIGYNLINQEKDIEIKDLELMLKQNYKQSLTDKILKSAIKVSVLDYIKQNLNEQENLKGIEEELQKTLKLMENKKQYIEEITKEKRKYIKEIEDIDKYINDDLLLKKEYIRQNEKLPQDQRVFSLSDFSEKIEVKRQLLNDKIKVLTAKLKPQNYVKEKTKIEKRLSFIKELNLGNIEEAIQEYIECVLKALNIQIQKIEIKKDIVDKIYILRYLKLINVDNKKTAGDICKKQFEKIEKNLITVGCNLKALNIFSQDIEENYKIYKNIFNTKIIDLESAYIEISKENLVKIYDENSLEIEEQYSDFKELAVKYNKKTRLFI